MHRFTLSVLVLLAVVATKRKKFEQILFLIQADQACGRQMKTINLLHKYFSTKHFQIGIIFQFSCYQQSNQLLLNKNQSEFSRIQYSFQYADQLWFVTETAFTENSRKKKELQKCHESPGFDEFLHISRFAKLFSRYCLPLLLKQSITCKLFHPLSRDHYFDLLIYLHYWKCPKNIAES